MANNILILMVIGRIFSTQTSRNTFFYDNDELIKKSESIPYELIEKLCSELATPIVYDEMTLLSRTMFGDVYKTKKNDQFKILKVTKLNKFLTTKDNNDQKKRLAKEINYNLRLRREKYILGFNTCFYVK